MWIQRCALATLVSLALPSNIVNPHKTKYVDPSHSCEKFNFTMLGPWHDGRMDSGGSPFEAPHDCIDQQHCLIFKDSQLASLRLAAQSYAFPVAQADTVEDLITNQDVMYDAASVLEAVGIGRYYGPAGIGEYAAILLPEVNRGIYVGEMNSMEKVTYEIVPGNGAKLHLEYLNEEIWANESSKKLRLWKPWFRFRKCSIVTDQFAIRISDGSLNSFQVAAQLPGKMQEVCEIIQQHCVGKNQQFSSVDQCLAYQKSLPLQDPKCAAKWGGKITVSAQGESWLCKFVHSLMIPFSPQLHCFHVGPLLGPDANGMTKCAPTDCDAKASKSLPESVVRAMSPNVCDEDTRLGLEIRTLRVIPFCLAALALGSCDMNCSQAVNTFLMPMADKMCHCSAKYPEPISKMLRILEVDAQTVLSVCMLDPMSRPHIHGVMPSCADDAAHPKWRRCPRPETYVSRNGCKIWNWDSFEEIYLQTFTLEGLHMFYELQDPRRNVSMDAKKLIGLVDFETYCTLWKLHLSYSHSYPHRDFRPPFLLRLVRTFGTSLQVAPGFSFEMSHAQGVAARSDPWLKVQDGKEVLKFDRWLPAWDKLFKGVLLSYENTGTRRHAGMRSFIVAMSAGIVAPASNNVVSAFKVPTAGTELHYAQAVNREIIRWYLGDEIQNRLPESQKDLGIPDLIPLLYFLREVSPQPFHQAVGYTITTALVSQFKRNRRNLQNAYGESAIRSLLNASGLHDVSVDDGLAALNLAILQWSYHGARLAASMIHKIRRDPCRFIPLWHANPEAFIREFARIWDDPANGGVFQHFNAAGKRVMQVHAAQNRDPLVFENPDEFNPKRPESELGKAFIWGALEEDISNPNQTTSSTVHRACPARAMTLRLFKLIVPKFFPEMQCHSGVEVFDGVPFQKDTIDTINGPVEVWKARSEEDDAASHLAVLLHGFPDIPQTWSKIVREIRKVMYYPAFDSRFDFWSMTLPQWEEHVTNSVCDFKSAAERIIAFLQVARDKYATVVLIGHDLGGLLAYMVASVLFDRHKNNDLLAGLITINAPHPQAFDMLIEKIPASDSPISAILSPLWSVIFASSDYKVLKEKYTKESWFHAGLENAYKRFWQRLGPDRIACYYRHNLRFTFPFSLRAHSQYRSDGHAFHQMISDVPTLILWGTHDAQMGVKLLYDVSNQLFPLGRVVPIHGATHVGILWDHATEVSHEISKFFFERVSEKIAPLRQVHLQDASKIVAWVFAAIITMAGFSLENFVGKYMIQHHDIEHTKKFTLHITVAKASFPLLIVCAVFSQSWLGAPMYILGMWKFGFPETLTYFRLGIKFHKEGHPYYGALNFIVGVAMTLHHVGSTILYSFLIAEVLEMDSGILNIGVTLVVIHWCTNLSAFSRTRSVATILALATEVCFQLECFAYVHIAEFPANMSIWMLCLSHWICLAVQLAAIARTGKVWGTYYLPPSSRRRASEEVMREAATIADSAEDKDVAEVVASGVKKMHRSTTNVLAKVKHHPTSGKLMRFHSGGSVGSGMQDTASNVYGRIVSYCSNSSQDISGEAAELEGVLSRLDEPEEAPKDAVELEGVLTRLDDGSEEAPQDAVELEGVLTRLDDGSEEAPQDAVELEGVLAKLDDGPEVDGSTGGSEVDARTNCSI